MSNKKIITVKFFQYFNKREVEKKIFFFVKLLQQQIWLDDYSGGNFVGFDHYVNSDSDVIKRSAAFGRAHFRPGKRSNDYIKLDTGFLDDDKSKRSVVTGRARFRLV